MKCSLKKGTKKGASEKTTRGSAVGGYHPLKPRHESLCDPETRSRKRKHSEGALVRGVVTSRGCPWENTWGRAAEERFVISKIGAWVSKIIGEPTDTRISQGGERTKKEESRSVCGRLSRGI